MVWDVFRLAQARGRGRWRSATAVTSVAVLMASVAVASPALAARPTKVPWTTPGADIRPVVSPVATGQPLSEAGGGIVVGGSVFESNGNTIVKITNGAVTTIAGVAGQGGCVDADTGAAARFSVEFPAYTMTGATVLGYDGHLLYVRDPWCGVRSVDPSTGATHTLTDVGGTTSGEAPPKTMSMVGNTLYSSGWDNDAEGNELPLAVYQRDLSTGVTSVLASLPESIDVIVADAQYVWAWGLTAMYRIDRLSGQLTQMPYAFNWSAPGGTPTNRGNGPFKDGQIVSVGDYFYFVVPGDYSWNTIARLNKSTGDAELFADGVGTPQGDADSPYYTDSWDGYLSGLAYDGTNLYVIESGLTGVDSNLYEISSALRMPSSSSPAGDDGDDGDDPGGNTDDPSASAAGSILFLHGVTQSFGGSTDEDPGNDDFQPLFDKVKDAVPGFKVTYFDYYQDKGNVLPGTETCDSGSEPQQPVALPDDTAGMPIDTSQNDSTTCDSEGDVGQNAIRLDQTIQDTYQKTGKKVILVGYSMGGLTIRAFLAYSTYVNDGVAANMVDSVVTLHGVEQGSWLATAGVAATSPPACLISPDDCIAGYLLDKAGIMPNPQRVATHDFNPLGDFVTWTDSHSDRLPDVPFYNTWGDERLVINQCLFICWASNEFELGDLVLRPGSDDPTETPVTGGERFLPHGYTTDSWQWSEPLQVNWDPITDPDFVTPLLALAGAPQQHSNYPTHQQDLTVADCQTGQQVPEDTEIAQVLIARLQGTVYACDPDQKP